MSFLDFILNRVAVPPAPEPGRLEQCIERGEVPPIEPDPELQWIQGQGLRYARREGKPRRKRLTLKRL